jgi:carbon monoxide dehydrogenase subunit G
MLTNAGKDFISAQVGGAGGTATAAYVALTANSTTPAVGDTTLTGEITTASGGLIRALGTYAHTAGTSTYTITKTFTVNGSDSLPVTVAKVGLLTASSSGTLVFSTLLSPTATLSASGDTLTITQTVTLS